MGVAAKDITIVRSIYDAALDDRAWQNLPRLLAQHLGGDAATLWYVDAGNLPEFTCFNHESELVHAYANHFRFIDPWTDAVAARGLYSTAFHGSELVPDRTMVEGEFYYDFLRKADILPTVGAIMRLGPGNFSAIGIHRPVKASAFKFRDKQNLQRLIGHIEQVLILRRQLRSQRRASEMTIAALHSLSSGIVICDQHAHILFANAAAEAVAAKYGAISLHSSGHILAAGHPEHNKQLRRMIASAAQSEPGGALCLANEAGDRVLVLVSPLPGLIDDVPGRALVTLRSESDSLGPVAELLVVLFGLTAAEADLAWSLMQNEPLHAIQLRRGVSENTIRTQLAHVFAKTRTANQRELVRLLCLVPAPFAGGLQ